MQEERKLILTGGVTGWSLVNLVRAVRSCHWNSIGFAVFLTARDQQFETFNVWQGNLTKSTKYIIFAVYNFLDHKQCVPKSLIFLTGLSRL